MQFQVPQFIETEAKIVGPLTIKQFLYIGGAAGLSIFFYFTLQLWLFIILTFFTLSIAGLLAFMKYNGQSTPVVLKSAFHYFWNPRFYVWRTQEEVVKQIVIPRVPSSGGVMGMVQRTKLKDLLFKLTTTTKNIGQREHNLKLSSLIPDEAKEKFEVIRKATGERSAARRIDYS